MNQQTIRDDFLPDGRRISYKSLNDNQKIMAIIPYLASCDKISGAIATVAVENGCNIFPAFRSPEILTSWKKSVRVRLYTIVHLVSYLSSIFLTEGQKIVWLTDEDEIAANENLLNCLESYTTETIGFYCEDRVSGVEVVTARVDPGNRRVEDLISLCDLSAGATAELLNNFSPLYNGVITSTRSHNVSWRCNLILSWLSAKSTLLKLPPVILSSDTKNKDKTIFRSLELLEDLLYPRLVSQFFLSG